MFETIIQVFCVLGICENPFYCCIECIDNFYNESNVGRSVLFHLSLALSAHTPSLPHKIQICKANLCIGKVVLLLNYALCCGGIWGSRGIAPHFLTSVPNGCEPSASPGSIPGSVRMFPSSESRPAHRSSHPPI
jgi:hypothetical protein